MQLESSTVLITGGATGIGFALASRFVAKGARVIVCGRRESALGRARQEVPALEWIVADVGREADRVALAEHVVREFPRLNVIVNNAGIQRRHRLAEDVAPWPERQAEIAVNFEAPVHLTSLLLPYLVQQANPAVVNVSSGLAFIPAAFAPVYSATKAALHSFTVSLRHEVSRRGVEVIEIIPPAVDTDLGGPGHHAGAVPVAEFADAVMAGIAAGKMEIAYGLGEKARTASRDEIDVMSARMANPTPGAKTASAP